ncbi:MAG: extracellular solute-binding protein [Tessaracoccus sp.]|uniref:extracellular solute-binding protein n=1 Tax=Tessaracoccus sp. TaxID=1971211 RepID=UPI001EBC595D|nr:extracellular solute-binding protein [Tessaracoccus sp.]MBK7822234.1 extracellular solute-binding protein [Tessaracoccus sp.]
MFNNPLAQTRVGRRSFLLGGVAVAGVAGLSACGGNTPTPGPGGGTSGAPAPGEYVPGSAQLKIQLGPEVEGVLYPDGYVGPLARQFEKFGDGSTEYRIVTRSFPNQNVDGDNTFSKHLEEVTGVKVKYEIVPAGDDGAPKINAMMSSGDLPDAFMLGPLWMGGFSRSQIWAYGSQGMFMPLDELVDTYAPELMNLFSQYPDLRKVMTAPDGKMYMFPAVNQCYHCKSAEQRTWIHGPTLEKTGIKLESVKTLDDLEAMMRELKAAGVTPMSGYIDYPPLGLLSAAHLNIGTDFLRRKDGAISYTAIEDGYRETLKVANRFVKEGLIDKNGFSQNADQLKRVGMAPGAPTAAILPGGSQGTFTDIIYEPGARWTEFEPLPPVTGPDGNAYVSWDHTPGNAVGLILTSSTRNPEELIRWADYQTGLIGTLNMRLGAKQDELWTWATEGELGIDGRQAVYKRLKSGADNDGWWEMGPYNQVMDVRHGEFTDESSSIEPSLYRAGRIYEPFASPVEEYFMDPFFTAEQAAQIGELRVNIGNARKQGQTNFALGNADPNADGDWDAYVNSLKGAGLDQYLEILKAADEASNG